MGGGKHVCVDLTGVSPLVGRRDTGFVARQAVLKAEAGKIAKHEKACVENQYAFIPFAFDTFGSLAPDAATFLKRVQRVVAKKIDKHEKACVENQHAFIPFAFDTFGSLAPNATTFLKSSTGRAQ